MKLISGIMGMLMIVVLAQLVMAAADPVSDSLASTITTLNSQIAGQQIPPPLGSIIGNVEINLHIALGNDQEIVVGAKTQDKKVKFIQMGAVPTPSLNIYTDEATIIGLQSSDDPLHEFKKALGEKKITYKGVGVWNKIKFSVLGLLSDFIPDSGKTISAEDAIATFEDCQAAGNTITNDDPQQCKTKEGKVFTRSNPAKPEEKKSKVENQVVPAALPKTVLVNLVDGGFSIAEVSISPGRTVEWKNMRDGAIIKKAMIIGGNGCEKIKSSVFMPGKSYNYTFEKEGTCLIVDGIFATQSMRVVVGR